MQRLLMMRKNKVSTINRIKELVNENTGNSREKLNMYAGMGLGILGSIAAMRYYLYPSPDGNNAKEAAYWTMATLTAIPVYPIGIVFGRALGAISCLRLQKNSLEGKVSE